MTDLLKTVARRTCRENQAARRRLVVTLEPGDVIGFREHGRRRVYRLNLHQLYVLAVDRQAREDAKQRREERKQRRANR